MSGRKRIERQVTFSYKKTCTYKICRFHDNMICHKLISSTKSVSGIKVRDRDGRVIFISAWLHFHFSPFFPHLVCLTFQVISREKQGSTKEFVSSFSYTNFLPYWVSCNQLLKTMKSGWPLLLLLISFLYIRLPIYCDIFIWVTNKISPEL